MTAKIHIERMMHRNSIAVLGDSAASYALVKLIPSGSGRAKADGPQPGPGRSTSAAPCTRKTAPASAGSNAFRTPPSAAIEKLKPDDTLAIVGLRPQRPQRCCRPPRSPRRTKSRTSSTASTCSTSIRAAPRWTTACSWPWTKSKNWPARGKLSQVLVLTDGETSGEQIAAKLAQQAARKKIHLTLMGVGIDWKASLIKDLAKLSEGKWYYIDVNDKERSRAHLRRGVRDPGRHRLHERRNAPAAHEGHQDQARPAGGAGDQGTDHDRSRRNGTAGAAGHLDAGQVRRVTSSI